MLRRGGLRLVALRALALSALVLLGCSPTRAINSDFDRAPSDALLAAERLRREGSTVAAEAAFKELLIEYPESWGAARGLQDARRALLPADAFEAAYLQAQTQSPESALAAYLLGRARILRPADAKEAFERAARLAPQNPWPPAGLAYLHCAAGDLYLCVEAYEEAIERMPRSARLHLLLGNQLLNLKLLVDAQRHLELAYKLQADDPQVTAALGKTYIELGRIDQGRTLLEDALTLDPSLADAAMSLAGVYLSDREPERAEEMYRRALQGGLPADEELYGAIRAASLVKRIRQSAP